MAGAEEAVLDVFRRRFGAEPEAVSSAPGRVNLIGEHTDYNGGFVLPMALDRRICVAFRRRDDCLLRAYSGDFDEWLERDVSAPAETGAIPRSFEKTGTWRDYLSGSLEVVKEKGVDVPGLDVAVSGDVPIGAGLSSSAAFEVAAVNAFLAAAGVEWPELDVIKQAQRAENEFVGVRCGIMDQFTSVLAQEGRALFIDCRDLSHEAVPLGGEVSVVVLDTGVKHALGREYNERRASCESAARKLLGKEGSLRDVPPEMLERDKSKLDDVEYRRARHVLAENERVLRFVRALEDKDFGLAGALMYASHNSLRDDFEVSCRELDVMVEAARRFFEENEGAGLGARMTGGGFGGCTVNLVAKGGEEAFIESVLRAYQQETKNEGRGWVFHPAAGVYVSAAG